jgi:hypothetical protein
MNEHWALLNLRPRRQPRAPVENRNGYFVEPRGRGDRPYKVISRRNGVVQSSHATPEEASRAAFGLNRGHI